MIKKLLPIIFLVFGAGAGVGAGIFLRPAPEPVTEEMASEEGEDKKEKSEKSDDKDAESEEPPEFEYFKMSNQFVVPVVQQDRVASMVVLSLSLEVPAGEKGTVYEREPKLRDSFLQILFNHANLGGFDGAFTQQESMRVLRMLLNEAAERAAPDLVSDVLILEIARQDL